MQVYAVDRDESAEWVELPHDAIATRFSWYKVFTDKRFPNFF